MSVFFLGDTNNDVYDFLNKQCSKVFQTSEKINLDILAKIEPELIVSYGYRHIIKKDIIEKYKDKIINLHISYLPYNRGASPNFWSVIDNTIKGVTIHFIDEGVDTGDIIYQQELEFSKELTLEESYRELRKAIEALFVENWNSIKNKTFTRKKQPKFFGTYHTSKETEECLERMKIRDWKIKIKDLVMRNDEDIINDIQKIREKNNTHWMDIVKLAFEVAPVESRSIFKKIKYCDEKVNELLRELADNDQDDHDGERS